MEDFASAGASLTARASEETTNFSRVVCMLFDLGPRAMELVMEAHLPGESFLRLLCFVLNRKVAILVRPASQALGVYDRSATRAVLSSSFSYCAFNRTRAFQMTARHSTKR